MCHLYEVSYEAAGFSGTKLVRACSPEQALAKFAEDRSEYGDDVPTAWVTAQWAVNS